MMGTKSSYFIAVISSIGIHTIVILAACQLGAGNQKDYCPATVYSGGIDSTGTKKTALQASGKT